MEDGCVSGTFPGGSEPSVRAGLGGAGPRGAQIPRPALFSVSSQPWLLRGGLDNSSEGGLDNSLAPVPTGGRGARPTSQEADG